MAFISSSVNDWKSPNGLSASLIRSTPFFTW